MLHIGAKRRAIDRPIEHGGRREAVDAQAGDDGVCLPVAARRVIEQPRAARAPAIATQQVGRHATFVDEDVLPHIAQRLPQAPLAAGGSNVRPALFVGVYGFF